MVGDMIDERTTQNAQKIAFLVQQYPTHVMSDILKLIQGPPVDTNSAVWAAVELGYITNPDTSENLATINKLPHKWNFGADVNHLLMTLEFAFEHLAEKEMDLEEVYLSNWTLGYAADDVMIALNLLVGRQVLASYDIEDGESTYTFFTLAANRDKEWGRKQFKDSTKLK